MEVIKGLNSLTSKHQNAIVALGFFDGFHLGHQALIEQAKEFAGVTPLMLYTFNRHPLEVVNPSRAPMLLTTNEEKIFLAQHFPIDYFLLGEFNEQIAQLEPDAFLQEILVTRLKVKGLAVGFNYRYGKGHQGNIETLTTAAPKLGFPLLKVEPVEVHGESISSTRIRSLLFEGKVKEVVPLLGRPYSIEGEVIRGDGRGKELGFPTANLKVNPRKLVPQIGIYFCHVYIGSQKFESVVSVGKRPTFQGANMVVEAHLLDFERDLYGKSLTIEFLSWWRNEEKFASAEALVKQMHQDIDEGRRYLEAMR